jgi:hypothetical protein
MRKLVVSGLAVMALTAAPAQAVVDEGGAGSASTQAPPVEVSGIDYGDAAIGIGIGVGIGALAFGTSLVLRRQREDSPDVAGPVTR